MKIDQPLTNGVIVASTDAAQVTLTGTTNETVLKTVTIPENRLGETGQALLSFMGTVTNNANAKTLRVRIGGLAGTVIAAGTANSVANFRGNAFCSNRTASSQIGGWNVAQNITITTANATAAIDTTATTTLVLTGQLGTGTDSLVIEQFNSTFLR